MSVGYAAKVGNTYRIPRTRGTHAGERRRHKRELVRPVPNRDPNTPRNIQASLYDCGVVLLLLLEQRSRLRQRHPDVQLGYRDIDAEVHSFMDA